LLGYLAGVYVLEDVLGPELKKAFASGLNIDIRDGSSTDEGSPSRYVLSAGDGSSFDNTVELDLYGSTLRMRLVATDRFVREQFEALWLALPGAVLLLGLITMYFLRRLEIEQQRLVAAQVQLQALNRQLQDLSDSDPLTGLYNRRALEARLGQELDRISRHGGVISLLMVDIDHFKRVNDHWGHNSGDDVLVEFARMCKSATRNFDMVARWGGEEFAILLAQAGHSEALQFAQRLRREVAGRAFSVADLQAEVHITISIGISTIRESLPAEQWIEQADRALYEAKGSGRNCVRAFQ
jgi:diguanylate cyclase (GGDEF)-like protein